jgi:uncharacterized membrane protein
MKTKGRFWEIDFIKGIAIIMINGTSVVEIFKKF